MHVIANYSDLVSAIFGILGSIILGLPLIKEITDRRHWQRLVRFIGRQHPDGGPIQKSEEEMKAERELRDNLIDTRLGDYAKYRFAAVFGFFFLLLAFVFAPFAAADRAINSQ